MFLLDVAMETAFLCDCSVMQKQIHYQFRAPCLIDGLSLDKDIVFANVGLIIWYPEGITQMSKVYGQRMYDLNIGVQENSKNKTCVGYNFYSRRCY